MKTSTIDIFLFTIGVVTYKTLAYESQEYYYYDSNYDSSYDSNYDSGDAWNFATPPVETSWNQPSRSQGEDNFLA